MIVQMKKVTVLGLAHDRAATLETLRGLGVLHVKPVVAPAGTGLEQAREKAAGLHRLIEMLPKPVLGTESTGRDAWTAVADLSDLIEEREEKQAQLESLRVEAARIEPFGSFDPEAVNALAEKGILLKLYRASAKSMLPLPEGVTGEKLAVVKADAYWALFSRAPFDWEGAEEQRLPAASLEQMHSDIQRLQDELAAIGKKLEESAGDRPLLDELLAHAEAEVKLQEVRAGMGSAETIAYVQGFVPVDEVEKIREAAAGHGWGLVIDEPGPQDDVPVKLRPPRWATPIKAVFQGIDILPAYHEADVSVLFMIFFSLFFAMIIGDAGYGAIFLGLTFWMRRKLPRDAFRLLLVTSSATIVWGVITGTFFGLSPEIIEGTALARLRIPFLSDPLAAAQNIMGLCFLIGAVHLGISHLWNVWDLARERKLKALEQFGWFLTTVFMFFLADAVVIGGHMVNYLHLSEAAAASLWQGLGVMAVAGTVLIILFMMPPREIKDGWFNLALLPLNLVGNFTDVVSYVRLYAVGTASFAVANAFNTMIFGGEMSWFGLLLGAVFAFLAHTLNILLCVMGVLVHGIRLNTLEFSNHKGITWSGAAYRPFAKPGAAA